MIRLLVAFALTVTFSLSLRADWPQFLGPTRDGQSSETGLNWNWPQDGPPIAWKMVAYSPERSCTVS